MGAATLPARSVSANALSPQRLAHLLDHPAVPGLQPLLLFGQLPDVRLILGLRVDLRGLTVGNFHLLDGPRPPPCALHCPDVLKPIYGLVFLASVFRGKLKEFEVLVVGNGLPSAPNDGTGGLVQVA